MSRLFFYTFSFTFFHFILFILYGFKSFLIFSFLHMTSIFHCKFDNRTLLQYLFAVCHNIFDKTFSRFMVIKINESNTLIRLKMVTIISKNEKNLIYFDHRGTGIFIGFIFINKTFDLLNYFLMPNFDSLFKLFNYFLEVFFIKLSFWEIFHKDSCI